MEADVIRDDWKEDEKIDKGVENIIQRIKLQFDKKKGKINENIFQKKHGATIFCKK